MKNIASKLPLILLVLFTVLPAMARINAERIVKAFERSAKVFEKSSAKEAELQKAFRMSALAAQRALEKCNNKSKQRGFGEDVRDDDYEGIILLVVVGIIFGIPVAYYLYERVSEFLGGIRCGELFKGLLRAKTDYVGGDNHDAACIDQQDAKWLRKAAAQGHIDAQYRLGYMYEHGEGVERDLKTAYLWYKNASEQDAESFRRESRWQSDAQVRLADMYYEGKVVPRDYVEAANWYRKAAENNHEGAQTKLGVMYLKGDGVVKDCSEAIKWFRKAAEHGHVEA